MGDRRAACLCQWRAARVVTASARRAGVALALPVPSGSVRSRDYRADVLAGDWRRRRRVPEVAAERDVVVEEAGSGFCGAVVDCGKDAVTLEDRGGRRRVFRLAAAGFLLDGQPVTLVRPAPAASSVAPAVRR